MSSKKLFFFLPVIFVLIVACKPNKDTALEGDNIVIIIPDSCDTCFYEKTTEALLKFDKNIHYEWNNEYQQAKTVLNNGDTLFLSIGGSLISYEATLITKTSFYATDSLLTKTCWLARTFFGNGFESYDLFIANKHFYKSEESDLFHSIYYIILPESACGNFYFHGFSFKKEGNNTRIKIGGNLFLYI